MRGLSATAEECCREAQLCLERRDVARAALKFQQALELGLDPMVAVTERWTAWMLLGEFEREWQETDRIELRRRCGLPTQGQLVWDGRDFTNRHVLLRNDHGLGDTIQFIRYVPLIKKKCRRLSVKARPILLSLLGTIPDIDEVIAQSDPDPAFDVEMESTELPYIFRTTPATIPDTIPYLHLDGRIANEWSTNGSIHAGLVWASGPWNPCRSLSLADLQILGEIPGISYRSLQWGPEWIQAQQLNRGLPICNASAPIAEDPVETAASIMQCDLVLTVDTMVAHLAGALGKPVWVFLSFDADWRWMLDRQTSPWYPGMRLFRQSSRGDWSAPVKQVSQQLLQLICRRST